MDKVADWLASLGLGVYAPSFAENFIDFSVLRDLNEQDLKELGVAAIGHRRKLTRAIAELMPAPSAAAPEPIVESVPRVSAAASRTPSAGAERRHLSVMFCDLAGSTALSTALDPEDMGEVIRAFQGCCAEAIAGCDGYLAKYLGDGVLAYFGYPRAHEDDAERAVRVALDIVPAVARIETRLAEPLQVRIGIATGLVVVGDLVGEGPAQERAVVGETPNLAARLQALAAPGTIVISSATRKLIGALFAMRDLGLHQMKGFAEAVNAWAVEGAVPWASRFDALHGARLTTFVGREHEIGFVLDRWEQACEGERQLVLISGDAGIGKSRLVAEVLRRIQTKDRISYQASPLHTNTALYPVVRQLEVRAGFSADDTVTARIRKLATTISNVTARGGVALNYLADLMSLTLPNGELVQEPKPSADVQREAALETLAETIEQAASSGPLLIVVEDAHWLDATTLEFIERVLRRLERRSAMLLVTYRPEFLPPWSRDGRVGTLSLSRLGRRHALAIVESLFSGGQSLEPDVAEEIVAKSDGIPLFVEELTGSALEADRGEMAPVFQIPTTLRDALSARLDRLGSAKEVAQIGAAIGREFSLDVVAGVLGRSESSLEEDLDRLMAIDIVFQSSQADRRYVFKHALLQDAAYENMLKSRRREIHARLAQVIAELRPETADTEPEVLASHFQRAGKDAEAAGCWRKAGKLALQNSAYREAIGAFKYALALASAGESPRHRIDTNREIATAYFAVADIASVRAHLEQAAEEAAVVDDRVLVAEIAIQQCHVLNIFGGRVADARAAGQRALDIAVERDDDPLAYGARFALGQSCWVAGEFAQGVELLNANLPENLRDPERIRDFGTAGSLMIDSMATLGTCHGQLGEFDRAFAVFGQARELSHRIAANAFDQMVVDSHPARILLLRGDWEEAIPLLERNRKRVLDAGLRFSLAWQTGFLGYAKALSGDAEQGIELLQLALSDCPAVHFQAILWVLLVEASLSIRPAAALELANNTLKLCRDLGYRAQEAASLRLLAAAMAESDLVAAESLAQEALALARELGLRPEEAHVLRVCGEIHRRHGHRELADENFDRGRAIYRELKMAFWLDRLDA